MDDISQLITLPRTVIVDVRTPAEFNTGHAAKSVNIPLFDLSSRLDELKQAKTNYSMLCIGRTKLKGQPAIKTTQY